MLKQYYEYGSYGDDTATDAPATDDYYGDEMAVEDEPAGSSMAVMAFGIVPLCDLFVYYKVNADTTGDDWSMVKNIMLGSGIVKLLAWGINFVMPMPFMWIAAVSVLQEGAGLYLINKAETALTYSDVNMMYGATAVALLGSIAAAAMPGDAADDEVMEDDYSYGDDSAAADDTTADPYGGYDYGY